MINEKEFEFSKTHTKLTHARYAKRHHYGTLIPAYRLSNKLKINGILGARSHFKPYGKQIKHVMHSNICLAYRRVRFNAVKEYGSRHRLIIAPRINRLIRKHGFMGG